jgi:hypothetical protein
VTRAPAAVGKPNCDDKFRPGVYRVGTVDQRRDAAAGRKGTAQRALTATPDPFSPGSTRKGSAEPIQKEENRAAARFLKPSAGLEPATPSSPSKSGRVVRRGSESQSPCARSEIWCQHPAASIGTFRHPPVPREYLDRRGVDAERRGVAPSSARCAARGRVHGRHPLIAASKSPDRRALRGGSGDVGCRARGLQCGLPSSVCPRAMVARRSRERRADRRRVRRAVKSDVVLWLAIVGEVVIDRTLEHDGAKPRERNTQAEACALAA